MRGGEAEKPLTYLEEKLVQLRGKVVVTDLTEVPEVGLDNVETIKNQVEMNQEPDDVVLDVPVNKRLKVSLIPTHPGTPGVSENHNKFTIHVTEVGKKMYKCTLNI